MAERMRQRFSYANVTATIAVFVALGGGAYAAKVAKNSVGAPQIKKNAVGASELKGNSVGASETAAGSVGSAELIDGSVTSADVGFNALDGSDVNEATLFNDNSLTGADIDESTLTGVPALRGGNLAQNGTDVIALPEGSSLTYECPQGLTFANQSGAAAQVIVLNGLHNDNSGGVETVFATPSPVASGADSPMSFTGHWGQGVIITDDNLIRFELWDTFSAGSCDYVISAAEAPRNN